MEDLHNTWHALFLLLNPLHAEQSISWFPTTKRCWVGRYRVHCRGRLKALVVVLCYPLFICLLL